MKQGYKSFCISIFKRTQYTISILFSLFYLSSCDAPLKTSPEQNGRVQVAGAGYKWIQLTGSAAFPKSYNFQIFSVRDTLWVLHHGGTWFSVNGKEWIRSPLSNILKNNGFLDYIWFNDALYSLGSFDGNIDHYSLTTQIAKTTDFTSWQILSASSNLPKRFFYHPFVFKNKLWIIGGTNGKDNYRDAWTSDDAVHWVKVADSLPFATGSSWNGPQFILFKDRIYRLDNDVWTSADGLHWEKISGRIADGELFGYSPIVYDGKIWLIGCNRNGKFSSEVMFSGDGKAWHSAEAPWTPRGGVTTCIFKNRLVMTGGKYGGFDRNGVTTAFVYSNDVWAFEKE